MPYELTDMPAAPLDRRCDFDYGLPAGLCDLDAKPGTVPPRCDLHEAYDARAQARSDDMDRLNRTAIVLIVDEASEAWVHPWVDPS